MDISADAFDQPGKPDPLLHDILTNRRPPSADVVETARGLVERADPRFKDFRVDREAIEGTAVALMKDGRLDPQDARDIWLDKVDCVSLPLAERYVAAHEYEPLAKYLRTRLHFCWITELTPRNRLIFDGMIAGGEGAMAMALLRQYLKNVHHLARDTWRQAYRKIPAECPADKRTEIAAFQEEARRKLPGQLQVVDDEIAEIAFYLAAHGSREDNRAIDAVRDDIAKARKRFGIVGSAD